MKLKTYHFDHILTNATISYKIDGVQAVSKDGVWTSRAGKPLYNLPLMADGTYEVFLGNWEDSVSAVRTHEGTLIRQSDLYMLSPALDVRLSWGGGRYGLSSATIQTLMENVVADGYEGLCIKADEGHYKVKPDVTYDVKVTGVTEGKGKHEGKIGAMITSMGKVGTGLTDEMRQFLTDNNPIGKIIEVKCWELTVNGKFRHPRFIRMREDKDE